MRLVFKSKETVLEGLKWKKQSGLYVTNCPLHTDKTPSLYLYPDGHAYCYSCRGFWSNVGTSGMDFNYNPLENHNTPISMTHINYWNEMLNKHDKREWFYQRGFNDETIDGEKWGYDPAMDRYIITVWSGKPLESDVVQVRMRRSPENRSPLKYIGLSGHNFSELYNKHVLETTDTAYVFFGELDARLAQQYGFPSVSPTNGKGAFRPEWLLFFSHIKNVYIIPDRGEELDAFLFQSKFRNGQASVRMLPDIGGNAIKDFTDFIMHGGTPDRFIDIIMNKSIFNVKPYWTLKEAIR